MKIRYSDFLDLCFLILIINLITPLYALPKDCSPSDCVPSCSKRCSSNEVCVLGTMTVCGECPNSKCYPKSSITASAPKSSVNIIESENDTHSQTPSSHTGLIGSLIGSLIGGAIVLSTLGYVFIRHRNKRKRKLAVDCKESSDEKHLSKETKLSIMNNNYANGLSSPPYKNPSSPDSYYFDASIPYMGKTNLLVQQPKYSFSEYLMSRPGSPTVGDRSNLYRRDSFNSTLSCLPKVVVAQATQISRAKPQIMRVNTIRVEDKVTRQGSTKKTITPQNGNHINELVQKTTNTNNCNTAQLTIDDPFDDKNASRESIPATINPKTSDTENNRVTPKANESLVSVLADGEITIYFDGKSNTQ